MKRSFPAGLLIALLMLSGCGGYKPIEGHQCLVGSGNQENCGSHPGAQ